MNLYGSVLWKRVALLIAVLMIGSLVLAACGDEDEESAGDADVGGAVTEVAETTSTEAEAEETETDIMAEETATEAMVDETETQETVSGTATDEAPEVLEGQVNVDGSSTVFPISQAVAEEFNREYPDVRITVGVSGTGGGFERFCAGETDISNASRPIKDEEAQACEQAGIEYTETAVAFDGITVVVNPANDFVECLTVDQLNQLWMPDSTVDSWSDLNPEWPDEPIALYGPGTDSGTFDYFTDEINGEEGASRSDYTASEDDNVLVQGVSGDQNALGYFGYAYYVENQDRVKAVAIDGGEGCVEPTDETIESGEYAPLSRPIFIYVNKQALQEQPELEAFVEYYLTSGVEVIPSAGYIPLPEERYQEELQELEQATQ